MSFKEEEARRVIDVAREREIYLRVIGGLAVKMCCPSADYRALSREYGDIDYVGYYSQSKDIRRLFEDLGYVPNRRFNALQGRKRLMYFHPEGKCDVDVFLDVFEMCHALNFEGRLHLHDYSIPMAELLLSKLQVVQMNEKDLKDIYSILTDHELGPPGDQEVIDQKYIAKICGDDWGWYKTVTLTIEKCEEMADDYLQGEDKEKVSGQLRQLRELIEKAPKSFKWKMRARIGEKRRWYELPDEIAKPEETTKE
ncbi:MAG: hypothetical protein ACE5NP_04960 [Anaerolineae bacterium]